MEGTDDSTYSYIELGPIGMIGFFIAFVGIDQYLGYSGDIWLEEVLASERCFTAYYGGSCLFLQVRTTVSHALFAIGGKGLIQSFIIF